jgi:hypothetical protein
MRVISWAKARLGSIKHPFAVGLSLLALIAVAVIASINWQGKQQIANQSDNAGAPTQGSLSIPSGWKVYGGIARPSTDVRLASSQDEKKKPRKKIYKLEGPKPKLAMDTNAQTKQIADALADKRDASTLSSSIVPASFDRGRFEREKRTYAEEYAKDLEPGRVFASAQPGEGVPVIRSDGARFHRVNQGERVRLRVEAAPLVPISFSSMRMGSFENQLTSITVVAGRDGKAEAQFTASSGTIAEIPILVASPMTSGQVRFVVSVAPKRNRPTGPPGVD